MVDMVNARATGGADEGRGVLVAARRYRLTGTTVNRRVVSVGPAPGDAPLELLARTTVLPSSYVTPSRADASCSSVDTARPPRMVSRSVR